MHRSRALMIVLGFAGVLAAQDNNYPDRKAIIANVCPFVQLSGFSFQNKGSHFATNNVLEEHRQTAGDRI